jgi:DNA-binding transcriptional LysR family regulator
VDGKIVRLDLNLVSVLEAIMLEGSVTRAAATLAMSQPAVSNALRRARRITNDDLFIKVSDGVRPTARMTAMWPELHKSLSAIRASISPQTFDARSDATTFRLSITDSLAVDAVSQIVSKLTTVAPTTRIVFAMHTNANSIEGIERGTLDCAVGMFPALPRTFHVKGVLADRYVCIMRRGHPLSRRMSIDDFVEAAHVLVTPSGQDLGVVDGWLSLQGRTRNVMAVVNRFEDAVRIVAQSDLLSCVPCSYFDKHLRPQDSKAHLVVRELPFEAERILYKLVWHERVHAHPAHDWFRSLVIGVCGGAD